MSNHNGGTACGWQGSRYEAKSRTARSVLNLLVSRGGLRGYKGRNGRFSSRHR